MPPSNNTPRHRTPFWLFAVTIAMPVLIIAAALIQTTLPIDQLFRDTVRATSGLIEQGYDLQGDRLGPYVGAISNISVLLWCLAAVVSLFAASLIDPKKHIRLVACLLATGIFSAALMFDDLFLAHEILYPDFLGLSEKRLFAGYALLMLIYTIAFRHIIRQYAMPLFLLCMLTMTLALVFDVFDKQVRNAPIQHAELIQRLGEDGLKLIGLFLWAAYASRLAWLAVRQSTDTSHE